MMNSQFRQDLVSGDWIINAPRRAKRLGQLIATGKRRRASKKNCPFESAGIRQEQTILVHGDEKNWRLVIVPNKYPAVTHHGRCAVLSKTGPYTLISGIGHHDLVITRDHDKAFHLLSQSEAREVFSAFLERYKMLADDPCLFYISIFHNWGSGAGASVYHPHYQILAIPIVPPDVEHSLAGSKSYFEKQKHCVHCAMISWEKKEKLRVVYENKHAIAFCPFVSRDPFEMRVFPKNHQPFFEDTPDIQVDNVVEALHKALNRAYKKLHDPDYNFFIHTAPLQNKKKHKHYHWHIEVLPKVNTRAGFELGTGIDINVVFPEQAANILR